MSRGSACTHTQSSTQVYTHTHTPLAGYAVLHTCPQPMLPHPMPSTHWPRRYRKPRDSYKYIRPELQQRNAAFKKGCAYLERYCKLIAFAYYLEHVGPEGPGGAWGLGPLGGGCGTCPFTLDDGQREHQMGGGGESCRFVGVQGLARRSGLAPPPTGRCPLE